MKKWLIKGLTLGVVVLPITAVISCGGSTPKEVNGGDDNNNNTNKEKEAAEKHQKEVKENLKKAKQFLMNKEITNKEKLPSSYTNVNQTDILKRIFDLDSQPIELKDITIENIVVKPSKDDVKGSLEISFDLKQEKESLAFKRVIDKYQNSSEYQDTIDRNAIKALNDANVKTSHLLKSVDEIRRQDDFNAFAKDKIVHTDPSYLTKITNILGIDFSNDSLFNGMKVKSIQFEEMFLSISSNEKLKNGCIYICSFCKR